jgi:RNA polymerase sigma-70 factor (ECF subfamily)
MGEPVTRASLVLRLRDPCDETAWRDFVELYAPVIYGYLRKQGLQDADAADLGQDALAAVVGAIGRLEYDRDRGSFRNWLFTIVRNRLSNWRRSQKCRPLDGGHGSAAPLEQMPAPDTSESAWNTEWEQRIFAWACTQVRRDVSETSWQAFWRSAIENQPGKQIAAELGLSVAAVYQAHSRVLSRMKALVQSVQEP